MIVCDERLCDACGTCIGVCPADAITMEAAAVSIDTGVCIGCLACVQVCPVAALATTPESAEAAR
jgi:ferredoxin